MKNNICIRLEANAKQIISCKETLLSFDNSFEIMANALSLAGNKVRLKILFLLADEISLCVCDLSDILEMNVSAISQHLRKLKDRNLVLTQRDGQTIYYSLSTKYKEIFNPFFELIKNNNLLEIL